MAKHYARKKLLIGSYETQMIFASQFIKYFSFLIFAENNTATGYSDDYRSDRASASYYQVISLKSHLHPMC